MTIELVDDAADLMATARRHPEIEVVEGVTPDGTRLTLRKEAKGQHSLIIREPDEAMTRSHGRARKRD